MPLRCFVTITRLLPVVREECGTLPELLRVRRFDRACDRGMDLASPLGELRPIGDFPGERVLESVLSLWVERLLVEELGFNQRSQNHDDLRLGKFRDALEYRLGERLTDHRCHL